MPDGVSLIPFEHPTEHPQKQGKMHDRIEVNTESLKLDKDQHMDENWDDTDQACTPNTVVSYTDDWDSLQTATMNWQPLATQLSSKTFDPLSSTDPEFSNLVSDSW